MTKPISRKSIWLLLAIFCIAALLSSCGAEESGGVDSGTGEEQTTSELATPEESTGEEQPSGEEPAQGGEEPSQGGAQPGEAIADTGFRPAENGFAYQNYGDVGVTPSGETFQVVNLTSVEMRRLFGDGVCAGPVTDDGGCNLTPPAEQWMNQNNTSMNGGHCEGFAVLSQLIYGGVVDPTQFGASSTSQLQLEGNEALQRELAYWFTTQGPTWGLQQVLGPAEMVSYLQEQYAQNPKNVFRLGIMKEDQTGGHAITAYGVTDQGNGIYWVMVYDNNYPGQERHMTVDLNANTWEYEASINPSVEPDLYKGSPSNPIFVADNEPRLQVFPCDFCEQNTSSSKGGSLLAAETQQYNEIWTEGYVNLALIDEKDRMIGYDENDKFVNEITEAKLQHHFNGPLSEVPPVIEMPVGMSFTAAIYGDDKASEEPASVIMIGQGFYIGMDNLQMVPGQLDTLQFDGEGDFITYTTDAEESPDIIVGIEKPDADFELVLKAVEISKGTDIHVLFDQKEDTFAFQTTSDAPAKFSISITRIGEDGEEETFDTGDELIEIEPGKLMIFYFGDWKGQGSSLVIGYDENGNGDFEDSEVTDMTDAE